jgi:hypothetical protein
MHACVVNERFYRRDWLESDGRNHEKLKDVVTIDAPHVGPEAVQVKPPLGHQ